MALLLVGMLGGAALAALFAINGARPAPIAGLLLTIFAAAAIATAPAGQTLRLAFPLLRDDASSAGAVLWLIAGVAAFGGGALGWALRAVVPAEPPTVRPPGSAPPDPFAAARRAAARRRVQLEAGIVIVSLVVALVGALFSQTSMPRALLSGLFAGVAIVASLELRDALSVGVPEFRSGWGGLGGGLGGWEISRQAVLLIIILAFSGAALVAAVGQFTAPENAKISMEKPADNPAKKPPDAP
jgi:hypothetical protein